MFVVDEMSLQVTEHSGDISAAGHCHGTVCHCAAAVWLHVDWFDARKPL